MKKVKYLLLLGVFALITTGCVKFNANMDIKKDKSMDFSLIYAFDKTVMGESNDLKEEDFEEAKKQGFEVTKYTEGNYEGFKLIKKIANIDEVSTENDITYDISSLMEENDDNKYIFKVIKGTDKNTYVAKIKFSADSGNMNNITDESDDDFEIIDDEAMDAENTPDEEETLDGTDGMDDSFSLTSDGNDMDLSALMGNLDLSFNVTLPNGAVSSNATTKENDNKKLSWKLGTSGEQLIEFTFELSNGGNNMTLYIGIGVAAVVVIALLALILSKKKNKNIPEIANSSVEDSNVREPEVNNNFNSVAPELNSNLDNNNSSSIPEINNNFDNNVVPGINDTNVNDINSSVENTSINNQDNQ